MPAEFDDRVIDAAAPTYYTCAATAPDQARRRAQSGSAIASSSLVGWWAPGC